MRKLLSLLVMTASTLILLGCAEKWVKPGATELEFEATKAACISQSWAHFPPMNRQVQLGNGYITPLKTNCKEHRDSVNCYTTGGQYVPPTIVTVDDNEEARDQDIRYCFFQNGWQPVKDGPAE